MSRNDALEILLSAAASYAEIIQGDEIAWDVLKSAEAINTAALIWDALETIRRP